MKKPCLDNVSHWKLALMAQNEVLGVDIKVALEHIEELETYITVHDEFIQDLTSRLNMSGKEQKKQINKIKRGVDRYMQQFADFESRGDRGEFDDYPGYKEACDILKET